MMIRLLAGTYRWLPYLFCAGLAACHGQPVPGRFQADLCGERHAWDIAPTGRDMLYVAQIPGDRELVVSLRIPSAKAPDGPGTDVQFNLFTLPDALHSDRIDQIVGRYPLSVQETTTGPDAMPGHGIATVFTHPESTPPWQALSGELQITDLHRATDDRATETRATISGHYRFEVARAGTAHGTCAVSGSFQDASFQLRR
jgi:hypothetical protein